MRYIIDIPAEKVEKISRLLSGGRYHDVQQFVILAIDNQLYIEQAEEEVPVQEEPNREAAFSSSSLKLSQSSISLSGLSSKLARIRTVSPPDPDMIPLRYLWGQYNRVFPVKLTLRVFLSSLKEGKSSAPLDEIQEVAVNIARKIGQGLRRRDIEENRKSGRKLSTGLPVGRDASKANTRFKAHFVGYLGTDGRIWGAPAAFRFANILRDGRGGCEFGITDAGLKFATLRNPIIDEGAYQSTLSEEERNNCLRHISETLRGESEAMRLVLQNIAKGVNAPAKLNDVLRHLDESWSPEMTSTMRAGLVSRLDELGLLFRERDGLRVEYHLTEAGRKNAESEFS